MAAQVAVVARRSAATRRPATTAIGTDLCGRALLNDATLNKGTAFSTAESETLRLRRLLPARVETMGEGSPQPHLGSDLLFGRTR